MLKRKPLYRLMVNHRRVRRVLPELPNVPEPEVSEVPELPNVPEHEISEVVELPNVPEHEISEVAELPNVPEHEVSEVTVVPELTEDLIMQIIMCLPTVDAIRCFRVSKSLWKGLLQNFHVMDIDGVRDFEAFEDSRSASAKSKFKDFLNGCHQMFRKQKVSEMTLSNCIGFNFKVSEFLRMESMKVVRLSRIDLPQSKVDLPKLETLELTDLKMTDRRLEQFLRACPALEHLTLKLLDGVMEPKISAEKLLSVKVVAHEDLDCLTLTAANLRSVYFDACNEGSWLELNSSEHLHELELHKTEGKYWMHELISLAPQLKVLTIVNYCGKEPIRISSFSLVSFTFKNDCVGSSGTEGIEVDTPSLSNFVFEAFHIPKLTLMTSNPFTAQIIVMSPGRGRVLENRHKALANFISALDGCTRLTLASRTRILLMPLDDLKHHGYVGLPSLRFFGLDIGRESRQTELSGKQEKQLRKNMAWIAPEGVCAILKESVLSSPSSSSSESYSPLYNFK